jgi:hypothetical protein
MKHTFTKLALSAGSISADKARLILLIVTLSLFIIGAGAPASIGGVSG